MKAGDESSRSERTLRVCAAQPVGDVAGVCRLANEKIADGTETLSCGSCRGEHLPSKVAGLHATFDPTTYACSIYIIYAHPSMQDAYQTTVHRQYREPRTEPRTQRQHNAASRPLARPTHLCDSARGEFGVSFPRFEVDVRDSESGDVSL